MTQWEREKKLIPVMIRKYCHGHHGTKGKEVCEECRKLTEYSLMRLEKCPFKENKQFCSSCKVHCYRPEEREKIRAVMRYSGPRMIWTHPVFSLKHAAGVIRQKRQEKKS